MRNLREDLVEHARSTIAFVLLALIIGVASFFGSIGLAVVTWTIPLLLAGGAVIAIILSVVSLLRWRKLLNRERLGLCIRCGYDVRGCTDRCSECGAKIWR